jgi:uncharacterized protein YbaP (TraB family)
MMRRALRLVLVAVAAAAAATAATAATLNAQPAPPRHMLFRVRGPNGATVYLLGSVHLLTPEAGKLPPEVDTAFAHAQTVTLETSLDSLKMRALEIATIARLPDGKTLRSVLSPSTAQRTDSLLHLYGLSLDQVGGLKPWFVDLVMTQLVLQKAGFQADYGVDMQLNERAHAANKPVQGLESVDFQMHLFDSLSPRAQEQMLLAAEGPAETAARMAALKDAWASGNAARLDSLSNASPGSAEFNEAFVYRRNRSWIPKIESLINGTSDALVVVGAAHLVGRDGVVQLLRAKGYTIDQL